MAQTAAGRVTSHDRSRLNPISAIWAVDVASRALGRSRSVASLAQYRPQVQLLRALVRELSMRSTLYHL